ncbi:MAG TPA: helix-turn-helix domain-containing protein [Solirubrobacteraceae bacterium]|nr:helix-turn-helix domain-containing protein [Solirubrobacteraceae bacterium]
MHHVVGLIAKQVVAIDLAIPAQIFGRGPAPYAWTVCAPEGPGATVATENGFDIVVPRGLDALEEADTVIVPGIGDDAWPMPDAMLDALTRAADRGARVASICTGAFVLAAAGLLDGRRATTHWRYAGLLARSFPNVTVDPDVLFVDDGDVLTSAGVAAGIDLCLHLVRSDHGAGEANAVARRIVVAGHREGGQSQFVERPLPAEPGGGLAATRAWMEQRLAEPLTVDAMAAHAGYSPRSFARRFVAETGVTPLQWLIARRVSEAQRLLEGTDLGVDAVAGACGLGSAPALRAHFGRIVGTTPTAYRRAFRGSVPREATR